MSINYTQVTLTHHFYHIISYRKSQFSKSKRNGIRGQKHAFADDDDPLIIVFRMLLMDHWLLIIWNNKKMFKHTMCYGNSSSIKIYHWPLIIWYNLKKNDLTKAVLKARDVEPIIIATTKFIYMCIFKCFMVILPINILTRQMIYIKRTKFTAHTLMWITV